MGLIIPFRLRIPLGERPPTPREARRRRFWRIIALGSGAAVLLLAVSLQIAANAARPPRDAMSRFYFASCAEARAAHAAPLLASEPWYRPELDRDHDGLACEVYLPTAIHDALAAAWQTIRIWLGREEMVDATGIEPVTPSV